MKQGMMSQWVAENIKRLRAEQSLSLRDLAEKSGIHYTALSRIESGQRAITADEVADVSLALGLLWGELMSPPELAAVGDLPDQIREFRSATAMANRLRRAADVAAQDAARWAAEAEAAEQTAAEWKEQVETAVRQHPVQRDQLMKMRDSSLFKDLFEERLCDECAAEQEGQKK